MNATAYYQFVDGEVKVLSISTSVGSRPLEERFLNNLEHNGHTMSVYVTRAIHYNPNHPRSVDDELYERIVDLVKEKMKMTLVKGS